MHCIFILLLQVNLLLHRRKCIHKCPFLSKWDRNEIIFTYSIQTAYLAAQSVVTSLPKNQEIPGSRPSSAVNFFL